MSEYHGSTSISSIQQDVLRYRGYEFSELVWTSSFEEVAYLLIEENLPSTEKLAAFKNRLASDRNLPVDATHFMKALPKGCSPMHVIREVWGWQSLQREDVNLEAKELGLRRMAQFPALISTWHSLRAASKESPISSQLSTAELLLMLLRTVKPGSDEIEALDRTLIVHADHEFNISTFAARLAASTDADFTSCLLAGLCTLSGPLHGGANQFVMKMLREIRDPKNAHEYVKKAINEKRKIMGFGHLIYKNGDPRAIVMKKICEELSRSKGMWIWYDMACELELAMREAKSLKPNVDFFSAPVYHLLGFEDEYFPTLFVAGRMPGWIAHILEQKGDPRILTARARYTGPDARKKNR